MSTPTVAINIESHVMFLGFSFIQNQEIIAVRNGPADIINNAEATEV